MAVMQLNYSEELSEHPPNGLIPWNTGRACCGGGFC